MADLIKLHRQPLSTGCRYFEIPRWNVMTLGVGTQHLDAFRDRFQAWLEVRPHRQTRHNHQTLSLLADCRVLLQAATCRLSTPHERLRWQVLEMSELTDRQLMLVILDTLGEVDRSLIALRRDECRLTGEPDRELTPIIHNLLRFVRRIEHLLDPAPGKVLTLKEDSSHE